MVMKKLALMILRFAAIRTIVLSTAITLYRVVLGFFSTDYARCAHVHVYNIEEVK
jgi:hypothetical protein